MVNKKRENPFLKKQWRPVEFDTVESAIRNWLRVS